MSLETCIKECSAGLVSIRATERKKSAESLKDFLMRNAVPSLLSENTIKKKGYTWNDVFNDINELILKETEKFETSKSFETVTGPLCTSLLHLCISGSNKGKAFIKCENIIEACLFILKDKRLTKAIGDAYLNLLYKHILPCDHYLSYITPTAWEELLDVSLSICTSKQCKLDDFTKFRFLLLVIKNGTNSSQFVIPLRDAISKLKMSFLGVAENKKVQEVTIEIMIVLLETLSLECRLTMCEFTETLLNSVLKFYDQNFDQKKKSSLFKLLRLVVVLHHPQGRKQNEEGSLANDWDIWNKHLHNILEIICLEATHLQKSRKQYDILLNHCDEYFYLAAPVYFQIFNLDARIHDENGNSSKKQRVTINKNKLFSDLIEECKQNHVPWLAITHMYIKHYGQTISEADYVSLISVMGSLITSTSNSLNWEIIDEMARLIIHNLTAHNTTGEHDVTTISLWNSCVRMCTVKSAAHKAVHSIIQLLLSLETVKYQNVQPLIKLYFENGMPVTDHSVNTLSHVFHKFFNKCSHFNERIKCFTWLIQGQITSLDVKNIEGLLLRLLASENINLMQTSNACSESDKIHDVLLNSIEKSTLFSEFEINIPKSPTTIQEKPQQQEHTEINTEVIKEVNEYFKMQLLDHNEKFNKQEITLLEYTKFNRIILAYVDIILKYNFVKRDHIKEEQLYCSLKQALKRIYESLTDILRHSTQSSNQIELLKCVHDMLITDYDPLLNVEIRSCISESFFYCINNILNREVSTEDAETLYEGDEINPNASRHQCICLLAAYCRLRVNFRDEILELIMDPKLYNFNITWDIDCAVDCIELLYHEKVEDPPLEPIFTLMQGMCKDLFRNSDASFKILKILINIIDKIWSNDNSMRQNCYIMVKSYLLRCEKLYYPPIVVALVYKCAAKITVLNLEQSRDVDNIFLEAIMEKIKGTSHTLRLYCCYLLRPVMVHLSDADTQSYLEGLMEIFTIKVSERNETILKDESSNRTLTVLHCFYALAQTRNSLINNIVPEIMQIQNEKSMDQNLVKKVLNRITEMITKTSIDVYTNDNVLAILNFWFTKNNSLENLPLFLFGIANMDAFLEKHLKWLMAADILWRHGGIIKDSDVLKKVQSKFGKPVDYLIEMCICNILVLCLPYIVTEKYRLSFTLPGRREWSANASKMFLLTRQILGDTKWSSVFVENMSELVMLIATHLNDHVAAKEEFQVNIPKQTKSYHYPKEVFSAILNEIGGLIDENILQYHCENQPLVIFKTLFKLWENVLKENVFEYKVLFLHTFITFLESVPLGYPSDAFVWNFTCNSLGHAIRASQNKDEIKVFTKALKIILQRLLPGNVDMLRKAVTQVLSILMIKKEEGFQKECSPLMNYLVIDMKDCLKESEDVIDFITPVSQVKVENVNCSSMEEFKTKLKMFKKSLSCSSHETLLTMRQFLKQNKQYINKLSDEINTKGFSDDCGSSIIHQIMFSLSNTLKSASDDKTKIESCNCLAEIGNYDLKTLVTVPPANTQTVIDIRPKQYFAIVVMKSLSDILFDKNPVVTSGVARTLRSLLKYREGKLALDLEEDKQILTPFSTMDCKTFAEFKINEVKFNAMCGQWIPNSNENHCQWLTRMTVALLGVLASSSNYLKDLRAVCALKPILCQKILPPSLGLLLDCSSEHHVKIIGDQIDQFFKYMWEMYFNNGVESSYDSNSSTEPNHNLNQDHKMIVQYMLDIVNFVRLQRNHYSTRPDRTVETLNYLRLEYDKVAWAATIADQNLAAIYYGELWASAQNGGVPPSSPEATTQLTGGENVQNVFRKCFVSIGELDAVDGCGTAHLTSEDEKRKHLINTSQYSDALLLHDIALSHGTQVGGNLHRGVVKSLHMSGMHHLALRYIKSLPENDELNDIKYECLSFLGDWSDFVDTRELEEKSKQTNHNPNSTIKALRYSCLKDCLNLQTTPDIETKLVLPLNLAKLSVARLCQNQNMENCQSVYKVLTKLHLFRDIEDYFSVRCNKSSVEGLLDQWQVDKLPSFQDFQHLEALISQRSLILDQAANVYSNSLRNIASLQLQYAELSLSNQRVQMAQRLLAVVKKHQSCEEVALVDSQISWAKGHKDIALSLLRNIVAQPSPDVKLNAISLRQYGLWMAESKCDNARDIINKYLKKSLEVLDDNNHQDTRLKVYYDIAKFADAEYKQVVSYMNSSIFEKKVKCAESMKGTALSMKSTQTMTKDERKALNANQKFGQIDAAEIASTRAEKESFLHLAMRYYLLSLKQGESNNLSVFRVISLWLDNPNIELTDSEQSSFEELLHGIPSWKYVTVLPQLAPRLTNENNTFAENLRKIIKRCALEHPHHTLPILFSLKNSDKDRQILNASGSVGGSTQRLPSQEPRVVAADNIISQLAQENGVMALIISQMAKMCDATISFANYVPKTKEQRQKIPSAERIHRLGHLDAIPIPTVTIPISHDCKYSNVTSLYSFENYFELVGGINCPKKIICKGSDGKARIVLVKGEDDLRQDAVMQQVFNIVNTLLENNPVTSRNKLLIRTYKVVPMSRRSGVLEWCEGTMPIGTYLIGGGGGVGAHARYRPTDISFAAAREKLIYFHGKRKSNQEKLAVFIKIMKEFRPVFHYFFTEHYLDPVTWYERRLAYTKSVATSSMVGYILGLGDRHLQNILIDKKSAEVVHIDFGISFDQGKTLPTPETIPFRLTQDIVAGFGSCGVEGIFRRCCEKTMQLLRDNQETLLTILEVLLCDPLYSWTVTSKQQNVLPATSGDISVNHALGSDGSLAKRALLSVSSKLNGTEGGTAGGVAVPGQVARLVHAARDPANLCRLYPGWQPYL